MIVNMVAPWGTKYHYMSGIHTNVTTVKLPSGQAWYSYPWDSPQKRGNGPVSCCIGAVRRDYTKWWDSKRVEHLIEGLRKAGLEIPDRQ